MSDATLLSVSTCGIAQSGSLTRCVSGPEQVGAADRNRVRPLVVHMKSLLEMWDVCPALALDLVAQYGLTGDTVEIGLGMAVRALLGAAGWF